MRCQIKAESLLFPTMYKSRKVTFPTCSGFCGSGSHIGLPINGTSSSSVHTVWWSSLTSLKGRQDQIDDVTQGASSTMLPRKLMNWSYDIWFTSWMDLTVGMLELMVKAYLEWINVNNTIIGQ